MPAKSIAQQKLMGMVHAYQQGKLKNPSRKIKEIAEQISERAAEEYASTPHDNLPKHAAALKLAELLCVRKRRNRVEGISSEELKKGTKKELEHTSNEDFARQIALDHLKEDKQYYTKLEKVEHMKDLIKAAYERGFYKAANVAAAAEAAKDPGKLSKAYEAVKAFIVRNYPGMAIGAGLGGLGGAAYSQFDEDERDHVLRNVLIGALAGSAAGAGGQEAWRRGKESYTKYLEAAKRFNEALEDDQGDAFLELAHLMATKPEAIPVDKREQLFEIASQLKGLPSPVRENVWGWITNLAKRKSKLRY